MKNTLCECCRLHKDAKPIDYQGIKRRLCDPCAAFLFRAIADLRAPTPVIVREPYIQLTPPIILPSTNPNPFNPPYEITCHRT